MRTPVPASDFDEPPVPFDAVLDQLRQVVADTRVVIDNDRSTDRLDYESGPLTAIAIGGITPDVPLDYQWCGAQVAIARQIGNAVPVKLAGTLGRLIAPMYG